MKGLDYIIIVPNEDILDAPIYHKILKKGKNHFYYVLRFSKMYKLNIKFKDTFPQFQAASLGHMVIDVDSRGKNCILYLPEHLSKRQKNFLNNIAIRMLFKKFDLSNTFSFSVVDSNVKFIDISPYVSNYKSNYDKMRMFIANYSKETKGKSR